jgi:hypothetical protein
MTESLADEKLDRILKVLAEIMDRLVAIETRQAAMDSPLITGDDSE